MKTWHSLPEGVIIHKDPQTGRLLYQNARLMIVGMAREREHTHGTLVLYATILKPHIPKRRDGQRERIGVMISICLIAVRQNTAQQKKEIVVKILKDIHVFSVTD